VGALNNNGSARWEPNSYKGSNYGKDSVAVFAPGQDIICGYPEALCVAKCNAYTWEHIAPGYHMGTGTSFSTAFVTGVAALLKSSVPSLVPDRIKRCIIESADAVAGIQGGNSGNRLNADNLVTTYPYGDGKYIKCSVNYSSSLNNHFVVTGSSYDIIDTLVYKPYLIWAETHP
jgi:subtilisin family serine protease